MSFGVPAVLVLFVVLAVIWYFIKSYEYWTRVGIPYVKPIPILGSMGALFANPAHEIEMERYKEKGRIYGTYEGTRPLLTVADPDVLRNIFVKDFPSFSRRRNMIVGDPLSDNMLQNLVEENWKRVRALMTPAFSTGKIKRMTSIFTDSAKTLTDNFRFAAKDHKSLDMKRLFGAFTMDVIASTAFGTKLNSHDDPCNPFVKAARNLFSRNIPWRFVLFFLFPGFMKFFKISIFQPDVLQFFEKVTLKVMQERKQSGKKRNDFLQMMMDASTEELEKGEDGSKNGDVSEKEIGCEGENYEVFNSSYNSKSLSNDEMIAQCVSFFLAGYDSTASTLSFAAYELALNPDIQDRLIAEIDEITTQKGELNYDAVTEMKYLANVISEVLRKYPQAIRGERLAVNDYFIKDYNITVPKGMIVQVPVYAIHHDPQHYPDPEKFDPDRFNPEQTSMRHPLTYLPFGAGPRNCIAMRFALTEMKFCLAYVLRHCRFTTCAETQVPLQFYRGHLLLQPKAVTLQVEERTN